MGTECKEVNKLSNIYTAVEEAALLQHFAVNKLATIGTSLSVLRHYLQLQNHFSLYL